MSKCGAYIDIGANDSNYANIKRCQLEAGHKGPHRNTFSTRYAHEPKAGRATIIWRSGKKRAKQ
jgi:hypothetical protein